MKTVINPDGTFTAIIEVIFSDGSYTARPGFSLSLCFPRLLISLPLVCPFLPSSITLETLLLLVENIKGLKPDHQKRAMRISISISKKKKKKKNVICQKKKWLIWFSILEMSTLSNTEESWKLSVLPSLYMDIPELVKCQCTEITNVRSLLSDVLFHINLLSKPFLQKLQTHMGGNVEGSQISHPSKHVLEQYS